MRTSVAVWLTTVMVVGSACSSSTDSATDTTSRPTATAPATAPPTSAPDPMTTGAPATTATTWPSNDPFEITVGYAFRNGDVVLDQGAPDGVVSHGPSTYTGDWEATSTWANAWQIQGDSFVSASLGVLDGEVARCGTGRFALIVTSIPGASTGGWMVVPVVGSGSTGLLGGSGTWASHEDTPEGDATGTITGMVACRGTFSDLPESFVLPGASPLFSTPAAGALPVAATAGDLTVTTVWSQELEGSDDGTVTPVVLSDGFGTLHLDGTWTGDATLHRLAAANPHDATVLDVTLMRFEGAVDGCGTGSMLLIAVDSTLGPHPAGQEWEIQRLWEIVTGFGTGDLATATGVGNGLVAATGDTSRFTGTMACS